VDKHAGLEVIGGTMNLSSPLVVRVDKVGADTVLSGIVRLLDRAHYRKSRRLAMAADRVASWFVLALLVVAVIVAGLWYWIDPSRAFWITVSVLVVSCPCALALATPAALTASLGRLTRMGLLSTRGHALETLGKATDFVFDKTGTLTTGEFRLVHVDCLRGAHDEALAIAAALEKGAAHPVAKALREASGPDRIEAEDVRNLPGQGVTGRVAGRACRLGSPQFAAPGAAAPAAPGMTLLALADDAGVIAWFSLGDELRPQARTLIDDLKSLGVRVHLYSGDRHDNAAALATNLGIDDARGGMLPEDKLNAVKALQAKGAVVAMTGDGVNDAPVLAQAQVSVAVDQGAEAAQAAADMILLSSELSRLADGVRIARKTQSVIEQNLAWSALYNAAAIPAAALGYVTPWMAGIGMSLSSLLVVLNAMRLAGHKEHMRSTDAPDRSRIAGHPRSCPETLTMDILYLLIPISLALVAIIALAFLWAVRSGQFEDMEGPAHRILMDDDSVNPMPEPSDQNNNYKANPDVKAK
jgi:Cu2+-exporting ATPase